MRTKFDFSHYSNCSESSDTHTHTHTHTHTQEVEKSKHVQLTDKDC